MSQQHVEAWVCQDNKKQISVSQPSAGPFQGQDEGAREEDIKEEIKMLSKRDNL